MKLKPEEVALFATPDFPVANMGNWQTNVSAPLKNYKEASDLEREMIASYIEGMKEAVLPKISDLPYANQLFRVPSEDQIFYYLTDGELKVILSQWGFIPVSGGRDVDLIDIIINQPRPLTQVSVTLHIRYSDGLPADNTPFSVHLFNHDKSFTTDETGRITLGRMHAGKKLSVTDSNGTTVDLVVESGKNDYDVVFDYLTSFVVCVLNQFDEAMTGYQLSIDGRQYMTDGNGEVRCSDVLLTAGKTINVSGANGSSSSYSLQRASDQNNFVYHMVVDVKTSYTITVVDQNDHVKPEYEINIDNKPTQTDAAGMVRVNNISWIQGSTVTVGSADGTVQVFSLSKDAEENNFVYHVNILPPVEKKVRIKILDYDGSILPGIEVFIDTKKHGTISSFTDEDGYATFRAADFEDREKSKVRFVVSKEYREKQKAAQQQKK